ncbi:urease accessory protein UreF [Pseudonocardia sp.]|uniref:urease accessory protein UreF n=1 Tax=Pseudonocardia sp. TaxID=60912 RepID=UPI003D0ABE31
MSLAALVLADARFPGGGHAHSGGLEEAVARGLVTDLVGLDAFLRGRLRTAGLVAAAFAAAAARLAEGASRPFGAAGWPADEANPAAGGEARSRAPGPCDVAAWADLDAELDARTPSPAQRAASRAQGRATLRAVRLAWPSPVLDALVAVHPRPHHPLLLGAVTGLDGARPAEAARCAGYLAVTGPASAAVRLLGLDPLAVNALVVALGPDLAHVVGAATAEGAVAALPAPGAPVLDLMAQSHVRHHREQVRLFAS